MIQLSSKYLLSLLLASPSLAAQHLLSIYGNLKTLQSPDRLFLAPNTTMLGIMAEAHSTDTIECPSPPPPRSTAPAIGSRWSGGPRGCGPGSSPGGKRSGCGRSSGQPSVTVVIQLQPRKLACQPMPPGLGQRFGFGSVVLTWRSDLPGVRHPRKLEPFGPHRQQSQHRSSRGSIPLRLMIRTLAVPSIAGPNKNTSLVLHPYTTRAAVNHS